MKDNISVSVSGDVVTIQIVKDGDILQYSMNSYDAIAFRNILSKAIDEVD